MLPGDKAKEKIYYRHQKLGKKEDKNKQQEEAVTLKNVLDVAPSIRKEREKDF